MDKRYDELRIEPEDAAKRNEIAAYLSRASLDKLAALYNAEEASGRWENFVDPLTGILTELLEEMTGFDTEGNPVDDGFPLLPKEAFSRVPFDEFNEDAGYRYPGYGAALDKDLTPEERKSAKEYVLSRIRADYTANPDTVLGWKSYSELRAAFSKANGDDEIAGLLLDRAVLIASKAHAAADNAVRDDLRAYITHPLEIAHEAILNGVTDKKVVLTALFHDLLEDTKTDLDAVYDELNAASKRTFTRADFAAVIKEVKALSENTSYREAADRLGKITAAMARSDADRDVDLAKLGLVAEHVNTEIARLKKAQIYRASAGTKYTGRLASKIEHIDRVEKTADQSTVVLKVLDRMQNMRTNMSLWNRMQRRMETEEVARWRSFLKDQNGKGVSSNELMAQANSLLDWEEKRIKDAVVYVASSLTITPIAARNGTSAGTQAVFDASGNPKAANIDDLKAWLAQLEDEGGQLSEAVYPGFLQGKEAIFNIGVTPYEWNEVKSSLFPAKAAAGTYVMTHKLGKVTINFFVSNENGIEEIAKEMQGKETDRVVTFAYTCVDENGAPVLIKGLEDTSYKVTYLNGEDRSVATPVQGCFQQGVRILTHAYLLGKTDTLDQEILESAIGVSRGMAALAGVNTKDEDITELAKKIVEQGIKLVVLFAKLRPVELKAIAEFHKHEAEVLRAL